MWQEDYLPRYERQFRLDRISSLRKEKERKKSEEAISPYRVVVENLSTFKTENVKFNQSVVSIGLQDELSEKQRELFSEALKTFEPWKKGPFNLFGNEIDAEWRSDMKWERLQGHFSSLSGRRVCDIGCHNGYFMFRMAEENPELVIGLEPFAKHYYNFQLMQQYARVPSLFFELLGVEDIHHYPEFFETIFCLGILYHHTDPVGLLRKIHQSLVPHGEIIIDCQGIPGEEPVALVPAGRYARARGIWFLPTQSCLENWLRRSQFKDIECFYAEPLSKDEQRPSKNASVQSLEDFLDPADPSKTIEGYPAPWRFYFKAKRG